MTVVPLQPDEVIRLNGTLSYPAWQRAPVFDGFVEKVLVTGAAPVQPTRVQVLYDEQAMCVGIHALDSAPERIRDLIVRDDGVNRTQEFVVVDVDAISTRSAAQWFRVNAADRTADGSGAACRESSSTC